MRVYVNVTRAFHSQANDNLYAFCVVSAIRVNRLKITRKKDPNAGEISCGQTWRTAVFVFTVNKLAAYASRNREGGGGIKDGEKSRVKREILHITRGKLRGGGMCSNFTSDKWS